MMAIPAPLALDPDAARARAVAAAVLDTRDTDAFARGHLAGAGHVPRLGFLARRAELPPRDVEVLVVAASAAEARAAADDLTDLGYARVAFLDAPLDALPNGLTDTGPAARLWRPSPFLERVRPQLRPGRVLDLAAGSGRESVFLALHGFEVEAWDHAPEALARVRDLAHRHGVTVATREVDLEARTLPDVERPWDVVMVFRFLHRPTLPWIERAIAPGGALVYETYRLGQERFGRPTHPRFLLWPGELSSAFPSLSVEIHEEPDPPDGPVMSRMLARKPE